MNTGRAWRTRCAVGIVLGGTLASCGGGGFSSRDAALAGGAVVGGMQALLKPECVVTRSAGSSAESVLGGVIATALLTQAASIGIPAAGTALTEAGTDKTIFFPATAPMNFYSIGAAPKEAGRQRRVEDAVNVDLNPVNMCLILYMPDPDAKGLSGDWADAQRSERLKEYEITRDPAFYFEAKLVPAPDRGHFQIAPQHLFYGKNLAPHWASHERSLVISFDFMKPSANASTAIATDRLTVPTVKAGMPPLGPADLVPRGMAYLPLPAVDGSGKTFLDSNKEDLLALRALLVAPDPALVRLKDELQAVEDGLQADAWDTKVRERQVQARTLRREILARQDLVKREALSKKLSEITAQEALPLNLRVIVAETREGSALLKKMGEILAGAAPTINKAIGEAISVRFNDAARETAEKAARDAANAAELKILQAEQSVLSAQAALAALPAGASAEQRAVAEYAVRIAKFNANVAYEVVGRVAPYADVRP